jgi:hypothetical protein
MLENGIITAVYTLELPKRGNSAAEYEDAFASNPARGRFAIADGASQSMFSALWAHLLVDEFVNTPARQPAPWAKWLPPLQESWNAKTSGGPRPWYAETKLREGAFATFLGVVVEPTCWCNQRWRALAIGDGCLFQIRDRQLYKAFPMSRSEDFDSSPFLVGSRSVADVGLTKKSAKAKGDWRFGDRFWLMTDAIGQWFLKKCESENKPWEWLEPFLAAPVPNQPFADWIDDLRNREELRNDDVTIAAICL